MATKNTAPVELQHHGQSRVQGSCTVCDWQSSYYGAAESTQHTKETGHPVTVTKHYSYTIFLKKDYGKAKN